LLNVSFVGVRSLSLSNFLAAALLDELTMTVVPSLIARELSRVKIESGLALVEVKLFGGGLAQLRYRIPKR